MTMDPHAVHCYGCGQENPLGLRLEVVAGPNLSVTSSFFAAADFGGATGLTHGGALATAIDEVLSFLGRLLGFEVVTGQLNLAYRRPVPVNTKVSINAWVTGMAGRKLSTRAEISLPGGDVAVEANALFIQVPTSFVQSTD